MMDWTTMDMLLLGIAAYVAVAALVRLMRGHRDKVVAELQNKWLEQQRLKAEQEIEELQRQKQQERQQQQEHEAERRAQRRGNAA